MTVATYIRTGALKRRARLQSRVSVADGGGGSAVTWQTERELWCAINELTSAERMQAMREQSAITHEIWTRYASDITADKRLLHRGVAYNVRGVMDPRSEHEFLRILAESGVST